VYQTSKQCKGSKMQYCPLGQSRPSFRPVHSIRDVIFPILKDRSARHNCCACGILVLSIRHLVGSSIPHLNTFESPLGYVACFLNLSFDVIYVICRLHNLRSPFKIPFYLVPPIVLLGNHMPLFKEWH
jgi:hypothetical protein